MTLTVSVGYSRTVMVDVVGLRPKILAMVGAGADALSSRAVVDIENARPMLSGSSSRVNQDGHDRALKCFLPAEVGSAARR